MARHALIHRADDTHTETHTDTHTDPAPRVEDRTEQRADDRPLMINDQFVALSPRETYGGTNWGACFFGWLVAVAVTVLLAAAVAAATTAVGIWQGWSSSDAESHARGIGLASAIAVTVTIFLSYYAGGYVAGRMSRFDGVRQGVGVWLIGILTTAIAVGLTALVGTRTDAVQSVDLSPGDLTASDVTWGAVATGVALLVVMLLGAVLGSAIGRRYHRRIDAVVVPH